MPGVHITHKNVFALDQGLSGMQLSHGYIILYYIFYTLSLVLESKRCTINFKKSAQYNNCSIFYSQFSVTFRLIILLIIMIVNIKLSLI